MMNKNWFNFYPMGHGLFYAGSLLNHNYNFVYDCGSMQLSSTNIEKLTNHFFRLCPIGTLEFIAISHFHKDHINGVTNLLKSFKVKEVIAPYISNNPVVRLAIFAALMALDTEEKDDYIDQILAILIRLNESSGEWQYDEQGVRYQKRYCNSYWEFVFASKPITQKQESDFETEMKIVFSAYPDCKNVLDLIKRGHINDIRDAYKKVFGNNKLNETSLVMFHYPVEYLSMFNNVLTINPGHLEYQLKYVFPVSLLTGDAVLDNSLGSFIDGIIGDNVSIIQVPHHGSYRNWKELDKNLKRNSVIYLVPKGTKQKVYSFDKTKKAISNSDYKIVDENNGYCYWITTPIYTMYEKFIPLDNDFSITINNIYDSVFKK